jgi:PAS domain S-box-containing protein
MQVYRQTVRILFVDDDETDYILIRGLLEGIEGQRFRLEWAPTYQRAREVIALDEHDVYLIDYRLGADSGLDLIRDAIAGGCAKPLILLTGQGDHEVDQEAVSIGAADYLVKGQINGVLLERSIRHAIERAKTLSALQASEERFRLVVENSHDLITIVDSEGTISYVSPSVAPLLGYRPEDLIGRRMLEYVHPEDRPQLNKTFKRIIENPSVSPPIEFRFLHLDGSTRLLESVGNRLPQESGVARIVLNSRDITGRRRAEDALEEREEETAA